MKTKILLFPLLLLIIIVTIIWFIVPTWNNIQIQKTVLKEKEVLLGSAQSKNQTISALKNKLDGMKEDKALVEDYVPKKINDEEIINSFIGYANMQGGDKSLKLEVFSIKKIKNQEVAPAEVVLNPDGTPVENVPKIVPVKLDVSLGISSGYVGLKEFFSKIATLKRSFDFESFKIKPDTNAVGALFSDIDLSFNYLDQYNPEKIDQSLLADNFDQNTLKMLRERANTDIMKVSADLQGRANPFQP